MNPVLILTHNCLELTKKCVESVWEQDTPSMPYIYDNASTDGTREWLNKMVGPGSLGFNVFSENVGVSRGWNDGLDYLFNHMKYMHALVINNDTILAPWTYRRLLACDYPFVTGASSDNMDEVMVPQEQGPLTSGPDFSCFLIRRDAWRKIGPFDENMVHYYSDNDYDVRAHRAGMPLRNAHIKFYHERSSTLRRSKPADRADIQAQADRDRKAFFDKYGCNTWTPEYAELFK